MPAAALSSGEGWHEDEEARGGGVTGGTGAAVEVMMGSGGIGGGCEKGGGWIGGGGEAYRLQRGSRGTGQGADD